MERESRAAYRAFFEEHYEEVLAFCLRRVDPAAAEDIAAETFLVAWRRWAEVPSDPLPWLFGVARKLGANYLRSIARRRAAVSRLEAEATAGPSDPGEDVTARVQVLEAFRRLSPRDQETLALVAWEGVTGDRAARTLGCSTGAFWVRLHRARRRLAKELRVDGTPQHAPELIVLEEGIEMEQR